MMKAKDCSVATALIIQGYLRANEDEAGDKVPNADLRQAVTSIRQECDDWAENLASGNQAIDPESITLVLLEPSGGEVARSPFNLVSAAIAAMREAVDLAGPEAAFADFQSRCQPSVHVNDLHKSGHPAAKANANSWHNRPGQVGQPRGFQPKPPVLTEYLIEAADDLVAQIDAATERPVALQAAWEVLIDDLRSRGVEVENRCQAPTNW